MEKNTQLPVEVKQKIWFEAEEYTAKKVKTINEEHFNVYNAYIDAATAYSSKLHHVEQENAELRRQNEKLKQQATGWRPLLEEVLKNDAAFGKLPVKLIDKITKFLYGE